MSRRRKFPAPAGGWRRNRWRCTRRFEAVGWAKAPFAPCPPTDIAIGKRWWARRKSAFAHPTGWHSAPLEHRFPLFNKGLHRLAMVSGHGGADQPFRLMIARRCKIEQQGFVEIVLHVA